MVKAAQRPVRRLSSFDFLTGIDDFSRMGGFRFKENLDGEFINMKTAEKIVSEVVEAVKEWREIAIRQGVSKREIDMFSGVLDKRYDSI